MILGVLAVAIAFAAVAFADNTEGDGDITDTVLDPLAYGTVCKGQNTNGSINVFIRRTGSAGSTNVFADGSSPSVSVLSATVNSGTATLSASVPAAPENAIALPATWGAVANNTLSSPVLSSVVLNATTSGTGTITYRSTGVNSSGATITRDGSVSVSWTAVNCDTTPPVITPSIAPPPNGSNGWHKSGNVDVTFSVTDAESSITSKSAACDATNTVSTDGIHSFTCTATSAGGTASSTATVKRDVTIPNIALDALPASTAASSINVTGNASDATSGVDVVSVNGSANVFNPLLGTFSTVVPLACGPNAISAGALDKAGNKSVDANATVTRICDTTPPVIAKTVSGTLGSNGWYKSDVTVEWSVTDPDSAVVIDAGCGTQSFTSNTAAASSSCSAHSDGGSSSDSVSLKIDKSAPVVSVVSALKADLSAYAAGTWSSQDVTVTFSCADVGPSGVGSLAPNPVTKGEGENQTAEATCVDNAGNEAGGSFADIDVDKTAPSITFAGQSPAKNGNGWNNSDVTLSWNCADALSGPASASDRETISSEAENQQATGSCADNAGNSASSTDGDVDLDKTAPGIAFTGQSPAKNANGWNNGNVTLSWSCTDSLSGPVDASVSEAISTEGAGQQATGTCSDKADNSSSSTDGDVNIDKSDPSVSVVSALKADSSPYVAGTWSKQDVTVTFACVDVGPSGADSFGPNPVTKGEGENQTAQTSCKDKAGNVAGGSFADIDVDKTAPTITFAGQSPAKNANGWNNSDVTLSWNCSDALSGVFVAGDSETISSEGENQQATGSCADNAGNGASSTDGDVDLDKTAPGIAFTGQSPAKNAFGWNNSNVTLSWSCSDSLSGPLYPTVSQTISSEGEHQQATGSCSDKAGNGASSTDGDVNIDKTSPVVGVTGVANGAVYVLGSVPAAGCSTADSRSGVQTNASVAVTGGSVNGVGTFTATCSGGKDKAGNGHAPVSVEYRVEYTGLSGILQPINPDNTSLFNRGKAVPVKFRLAGDEPNGFNFSGWKLARQQINCTSFDTIDAIQEPIVENPSNAFRYDAGADQYIYNANFGDKAAGTCWKVLVTLDSGQTLASATFKLQK